MCEIRYWLAKVDSNPDVRQHREDSDKAAPELQLSPTRN